MNYLAKKTTTTGFTLIETFVAITVLMIVVLGPMTLLSRALTDARYIKDEIIATYLAQEGVEMMINTRNEGDPLESQPPCNIYLNTDFGYDCNLEGELTIFTREIRIENVGSDNDQKQITSIVTRGGLLSGRTVTSRSIIYVTPDRL